MEPHKKAMVSNPNGVNPTAPNIGHTSSNSEGFIGVLEVFIHQARDIHNICIYHKQDVYAKIFLTNDPETTESTRTINGGGQNPLFNENLRINVRNADSKLRCEIWMLSRVRNYLQDQLLGFALVPLRDVLFENKKLEKEFQLSTSDLFHSPSGFVKLSIQYNGSSPDLVEIPAPPPCLCNQDSDEVPCELEKIEFPDPKVANENEMMVSEYYSTCAETESQTLVSSEASENDGKTGTLPVPKVETLPRNDSKPSDEEKESVESLVEPLPQPVISVQVEPEQKMVQQDIVDMYMKSMKQFTEALAKMKLPMDKGGEKSPDSGSNDTTGSNGKGSKGEGPSPSPKVFYGSRAFF